MGGQFFIFGPVLHVFVVHFALTTSCCLIDRRATNTNIIAFDLIWLKMELTIYQTHAYLYTTEGIQL
jgi:hypothetical protein